MKCDGPTLDPNRLYSISEAKAIVGCSRETIRLKIENKMLVAARIGRGPWRISGASLLDLLAPLMAIHPAVPTEKELNQRVRDLLRP